jgi:hypothetical protein
MSDAEFAFFFFFFFFFFFCFFFVFFFFVFFLLLLLLLRARQYDSPGCTAATGLLCSTFDLLHGAEPFLRS